MIIVRCVGEKSFFIEKVIFPSEIIAFNAPKGARVEIWGNDLSGLHLEDSMTAVSYTHLRAHETS